MIALAFAAALAAAPLPPSRNQMTSGEWIVIAVGRVIAPDQHPGECFIEGRVEQVLRGRAYRVGGPAALTLRCRAESLSPIAAAPGPSEPPTVSGLKATRHALVHADAGGRVIDNGFWALP